MIDLVDLFWANAKSLDEIPLLIVSKTKEQLEQLYPKRDEGEDFDELGHIQEQYNIKCDELLAAKLENRRLALIIIKNGLDSELEIDDDYNSCRAY